MDCEKFTGAVFSMLTLEEATSHYRSDARFSLMPKAKLLDKILSWGNTMFSVSDKALVTGF